MCFWVSMPLIGRFSFLHGTSSATEGCFSCVNALNRAILISTVFERQSQHQEEVSMPLIGRFSFLRRYNRAVKLFRDSVSMPLIGRYSFLHIHQFRIYSMGKSCVNALNRAILISTILFLETFRKSGNMCQCP